MLRKVSMASLLGYSTLLLTISIPPTFDPSLLEFPTPLFPQLDPRTAPAGTQGLVMQLWRINIENYGDEAVKGAGQKGYFGFSNSTAHLYPSQTTLLSVSPLTLSSFSHIALSVAPPSPFAPTLITLDPSLSPRLPFPLKRGMISTLARTGVGFELVLRGVTRLDQPGEQPGEAGKRRRNWIAGAREVVRATEGKGVVISSGAVKAGEMRGTEDLINLCSLIGMPPSVAKDALTVNPQRAVMRGLSLRQTYRGVISNPTLTTYPPPPRESDSDISEQQQRPNPNSEAPTLPAPVPTPASELGKKRPAAGGGGCGSDSALETTGKALREITGGGGGDGRVQQPDGSVPSVPTQQPKRKKKRKE
ncbi:PHP domain-like protein [Rhodotorula sp. JG-1b]|nr:PHP domain-like protein [Rhodotorula sp. JG-1b]